MRRVVNRIHHFSETISVNKRCYSKGGQNLMREAENPMMDQRDEKHVVSSRRVESRHPGKHPLNRLNIKEPTEDVVEESVETEFKYDIKKEFSCDAKDLEGKGKNQNANMGRMKKERGSGNEPFLDVEAPGG